jgi:cysteine desulfurase
MPRLGRKVYLDNNATTEVSRQVRRRVNHVLKYSYGNPSSLYKAARNSAEILEESRMQVAESINADTHEIYFTGSATEANNAILKSVSVSLYPKKRKIISTPIEHASVMDTLEFLETQGIKVEYCPVDNKGRVDVDKLESMMDDEIFLICCMLANNEIGTIQNLQAISRKAKEHNILVMSDCVQALGKIRVDVKELGLDYASFSAHKVHGPKGVGALFVKENSPFSPFIHGGHQESGIRAGTEGLHNIAGFATACCDVKEMLSKSSEVLKMKRHLIEELKKAKPDIVINSPENECLPNTVSITFPGINNSVFMAMLDCYGVSVSAGSACNASDNAPSHVLKAIGLSDEDARETIRISLSTTTTEKDIKYVIKVVRDYLENRQLKINMMTPAQLTEDVFLDSNVYILDVRFWHDRKILKAVPNSHEASFVFIKKYVRQIPRDKNILVVCQGGSNAAIVAYYLKSKGYRNVSFLLTGVIGWKLRHEELYRKYAGTNVVKLKPSK